MTQLLRSLLLAAGLVFQLNSAFATHIIGGEITYKCLGGDTYQITLVVFRDCYTGVPLFDDPASIGVFDSDHNYIDQLLLSPAPTDTIPIILANPCLVAPPNVCVETTVYIGEIQLPFISGGYQLVYQRCCRNQLIQNIVTPLDTGASFITDITEEALLACNNSPTFTSWPPVAICVFEPINWDHSAIDEDGDSIVYKLCIPQNGASPDNPVPQPPDYGTVFDVNWEAPFGPSNFLNSPPNVDNMAIHMNSGFITGVPNLLGNFVVGICIEEYRDGQLLSIVRRDFQYNVADCGAAVSAFYAPEVLCDAKTVSFDNLSGGTAAEYEWHFDWPNNLPTSNVLAPTHTFPDTGYYTIALIASKDGGLCSDTFLREIHVTDSHITADFDFDFTDCNGPVTIAVTDLTTDSLFAVADWVWVLDNGLQIYTDTVKSPIFVVPNSMATQWTLTLTATSANGCTETIVQVFDSPFPTLSLINDQFFICSGAGIPLNPSGNVAWDYVWSPPTFLNDPLADNPISTPTATISYSVTVTNGLCVGTKTVEVVVSETISSFYAPTVLCDGLTVSFENLSGAATEFDWYFNWPNTSPNSTELNPMHTYLDTGYYTIALVATKTGGLCKDTFLRQIHLTESFITADFSFDVADCDGPATIAVTDLSKDSLFVVVDWVWVLDNGSQVFTDSTKNPVFVVPNSTSNQWTLTLTATSSNGCTKTIVKTFESPFPMLNLINDQFFICAGDGIQLNPSGNTAWDYAWSPPTFLDNAAADNPFAAPTANISYTVTVTNGLCDGTKTVDVVVTQPEGVLVTASPDTVLIGESSQLQATMPSGNADWIWIADPTLSSLTASNPTATPTETTTYFVSGTDSTGCRATGRVQVVVLNPTCDEPFVFFPTGFSPNGDGENDRLRVEGAYISEINWLIYNRWGEAIFEAKLPADEWDGTFLGEKLPPDSYAFYLRVKCTGGRESIRKGNVTLLR